MIPSPPDARLAIRSLPFVMTAVLAAFVLFLGVNGLRDAHAAAHGFGVDLVAPLDAFYLHVKADRDLTLGAMTLALLLYRRVTPLALFVGASILAPLCDGTFVALDPRGSVGYALAVHGSAVIYGVVLTALLVRARTRAQVVPVSSASPSYQ